MYIPITLSRICSFFEKQMVFHINRFKCVLKFKFLRLIFHAMYPATPISWTKRTFLNSKKSYENRGLDCRAYFSPYRLFDFLFQFGSQFGVVFQELLHGISSLSEFSFAVRVPRAALFYNIIFYAQVNDFSDF